MYGYAATAMLLAVTTKQAMVFAPTAPAIITLCAAFGAAQITRHVTKARCTYKAHP